MEIDNSKNESNLSLDNNDRMIKILTKDTIIPKEYHQYYSKITFFNDYIQTQKNEKSGKDETKEDSQDEVKTIIGVFELPITTLRYSKFLNVVELDNESNEIDLRNNEYVDAELMIWYIRFSKLHNDEKEYIKAEKPAELELDKGFKNKIDLEFYTDLDNHILLLTKLIKMANYMDIEVLLHNCSYTFASYIKRTDPIDIIKKFKILGLVEKDAVFNNDGCDDCDDEKLPEYLIEV